MGVKKIDNMQKFLQLNQDAMDGALDRMAHDICIVAKIRVPYKEGDLQKAGRPERKAKLKHRVIFDSDYASYQERGERRDGSRKVRKYTTPNTSAHFLEEGGNTVVKDAVNYFKQANNQIQL